MSGELDTRLAALAEAAELAEGRLAPEVVEEARAVTAKAGARLGLGLENTVVALDAEPVATVGYQPQVTAATLHVALSIPEDEAERRVAGSGS